MLEIIQKHFLLLRWSSWSENKATMILLSSKDLKWDVHVLDVPNSHDYVSLEQSWINIEKQINQIEIEVIRTQSVFYFFESHYGNEISEDKQDTLETYQAQFFDSLKELKLKFEETPNLKSFDKFLHIRSVLEFVASIKSKIFEICGYCFVTHLSNQFLKKMLETNYELNKEDKDEDEFEFKGKIPETFYQNTYKIVNVFGESREKFDSRQQTIANQYHQRISDFEKNWKDEINHNNS